MITNTRNVAYELVIDLVPPIPTLLIFFNPLKLWGSTSTFITGNKTSQKAAMHATELALGKP